LSTAGKVIDKVTRFSAPSVTVTVALAVAVVAVSGVPPITPLAASMVSPAGRSVAS